MTVRLTSTDLENWSRSKDAESHLPTLVRQLVMAVARPDWIRVPAAESVSLPGLDGVLTVSGGAKPYVPAGDSMWEFGTGGNMKTKATSDYMKRTAQTPVTVRSTTTYVGVTSRRWGRADKWVEEMKLRADGWRDIVFLTADELTIWLEMCPGVEAWLREHLDGRGALGVVGLRGWFERWASGTEPRWPAGLLLAGRRPNALRVLSALDDSPAAVIVSGGSVDEAVAFLAGVLMLGPGSDPTVAESAEDGGKVEADEASAGGLSSKILSDASVPSVEKLEALLARSIVIEDVDGWRRWSVHSTPQILIPLFVPDSVSVAVDMGHHVLLPMTAKQSHEDGRLLPLDPHDAAARWQEQGVDFYRAHELALATRRNVGSVRRRLSRYGRQDPTWASSDGSALLASMLLAGGWQADGEGDREVLLEITGEESWRKLSRQLVQLAEVTDPPLGAVGEQWDFTDVIDAWDILGLRIAADELEVFSKCAVEVLSETDPRAGIADEDLLFAQVQGNEVRRKYSGRLRRGIATTLAVLGSVVGDAELAGARTGSVVATVAVRSLLRGATSERWRALNDVLGLLAEAAPDAFLTAIEESLKADAPAVMGLFDETNNWLGGSSSSHTNLLWALEALAFSPAHVSRVCLILARLAVLDPGGRLSNRPDASLAAVLDLVSPQGAVSGSNRLALIDAIRDAVPEHATDLMVTLVKHEGFGIIRPGPRFRDWPLVRAHATRAEFWASVTELCSRLLDAPAPALPRVAGLLGRLPAPDQTRVLATLDARWSDFDADQQSVTLDALAAVAERHGRFRDAEWAMPEQSLTALTTFLGDHGFDVDAQEMPKLFSWDADLDERRIQLTAAREGDDEAEQDDVKPLAERRREAVEAVRAGGLDALVKFAGETQLPGLVGRVLAESTTDLDDDVLDLLGDGSGETSAGVAFAVGLVSHRALEAGWLANVARSRPGQAAQILLCTDVSEEVLAVLDDVGEDQQAVFWRRAHPYRVPDDLVERVCLGMLGADRPFGAITALSMHAKEDLSPELVLLALSAPMAGTKDDPGAEAQSLDYHLDRLFAYLERAGVPDSTLARLEFFYLPALEHHRAPAALHRELARDPELFAQAVSWCFRPDDEVPAFEEGEEAESEDEVQPANNGDEAAIPEEEYQFVDGAFRLLRGWHTPLPGAADADPPEAKLTQAWVTEARVHLKNKRRSRAASIVIGEALAGPVTDPDGTWPCQAVRTVLENEQDSDLEDCLFIARLNQRDITVRGVYSGGGQERDLAQEYREMSERVRDRWPRSGAILESLARSYEADSRREDRGAERDARR